MTTVPMQPVVAPPAPAPPPAPRGHALRGTNVGDRLYPGALTAFALLLPLLLLALVGELVVSARPAIRRLRGTFLWASVWGPVAGRARLDAVPERRVLRQLALGRRGHSCDHDRPLHRGGVARGALGGPRDPARSGAGDGRHAVGGGVDRGGPLRTRGADRRRDPRSRSRAGRDDGGDHAHRQPARHRSVGAAARLHDGRGDRQRVQRGNHEPLPLGAVRSGAHSVRDHRRSERARPPVDLARRPRYRGGEPRPVSVRRLRRRLVSGLMTTLVGMLSFVAVLALLVILRYLVAKGASSLDWSFFVKNPVPVGQAGGGVANAN